MSSASQKRNSLLVTLGVAGLAVAYFTFVYGPQRRAITDLRREIQQVSNEIETSESLGSSLQTTADRLSAIRSYIDRFTEHDPKDGQFASVFGKITSLADEAGLSTARFDPHQPKSHRTMQEIPIEMAVTGDFAAAMALLAQIEQLPERIWVENLEIHPGGKDGEESTVEVRLVVFANQLASSE